MSFALRDFVVVAVVVVVVVAYLHKWCQVIIGLGNGLAPNGLPGPIPQFRDNLFKTHWYFAIKQNKTNISSSTIYLKTNKITNTTKTQILHRMYAHHIYWPQFIPDYLFCWIIIHVSPIKDIVISRIGNGHSATHPKLSGPDCIQEESCLLLCFIFPSPPLGDDSWSLLHEVRTIPSGTNKNIYCDIMSAVSVTLW